MLNYTCVECGKGIQEPYTSTMEGWCANAYILTFCSEECYKDSHYNSNTWPDSPSWMKEHVENNKKKTKK